MTINYQILVANRETDGSIRQWLNDSRAPSTTILAEAEAWIYQRLLVREMLKTHSVTQVAINQTTVALPSDFKNRFFFMFTGTEKFIPAPRTLPQVLGAFQYKADGSRTTGKPQVWAIDESNIVFDRQTDKAYDFLHKYYGQPTSLGPNNQTNFLTSKYPKLLRMVYSMIGFEWKKDTQQKIYYANLAEQEIIAANQQSDREELMGVHLQMQIGHDHGDFDTDYGYP